MAKSLNYTNIVNITLEPAEVFEVLSAPTRIQLIELIKTREPLNGKDIVEALEMSSAAVSQHLKVLRSAGIVKNEGKDYWIQIGSNLVQ
jgi:ArsR family transcriptional regulator